MDNRVLRRSSVIGFLLFYACLPWAVDAGPLPRPVGAVVLTITGKIENTNVDDKAEFDRDMLEALGTTELRTSTPWTKGRPVFEGVLVHKILEAVSAKGEIAFTRAINDYKVEIPLADFERYPVLLALKMNGKYMRIRDKGPLWVVYPWDQYTSLADEKTKRKSIWQLVEIDIR